MTGFEGLENAGLIEGPQEKATREFIKEYRDGKAPATSTCRTRAAAR